MAENLNVVWLETLEYLATFQAQSSPLLFLLPLDGNAPSQEFGSSRNVHCLEDFWVLLKLNSTFHL